jgi:glutathione peroxidase
VGIIAQALAAINRIRSKKIKPAEGSIYDFTITTLDGESLHLGSLRGRKMLLVNTASNCGYTRQYFQLQEVHKRFKDRIAVIGFPSNDFLRQEPGSDLEIRTFCTTHFGVEFPVSTKIRVTGDKAHPLFLWLAGKTGTFPTWNFCKYLISEDGETVNFFDSTILPTDDRVTANFK